MREPLQDKEGVTSTVATEIQTANLGREMRAVWRRNLWMVAPAYAGVLFLLVVGYIIHPSFDSLTHLGTLVVLASFVIVIGFGQGLAILTGGLDLSLPYVMTFAAVELALANSSAHSSLVWSTLWVLGLCVMIGVVNGLGIVWLKLSPIVMTLATNTVLNGGVLVLTNGAPGGSSPGALLTLMNGQLFGNVPILVLPLAGFVIAGVVLLERTTFGRRVYAVGNSPTVAWLSGVNVGAIVVSVYAVSALCSGLGGLMLLGFANQSFIGMGDQYLLPSIAAVVIGGASALGGRGKYIGTIGGAILLEALSAVLGALSQSAAVQDILYGLIILLAMLAVRV